jgi:DNA-binding response OmpR family regulator
MSTALRPCCLLAEDEALIALAVEAYLQDIGIDIAGLFATSQDALAWAQERSPDMALLDFKLRDGLCTEVALALLQRDIPVVIYSGVPKELGMTAELCDVTWIEKPTDGAELLQALTHATEITTRYGNLALEGVADALPQ